MRTMNLKGVLIVVGGVVVLAVVIGIFLVGSGRKGATPVTTTASQTTLPISQTAPAGTSDGSFVDATNAVTAGAKTLDIPTTAGETVTVRNFLAASTTWPDIENAGSYLLAGSAGYCLADGTCPSGASATDFKIRYSSKGSFFTVVLLAEPLGAARTGAQQFLGRALGLSEAQLCALRYYVSVPFFVNPTFAGRNLGFSACDGATALP